MNRFGGHTFAARLALAALAAGLIAQAPATNSHEDLPLGRPTASASKEAAPQTGNGPWLGRTLGALAVVVGLIVGIRLLLQRSGRGGAAAGARLVELLARSTIAPKTHILFLRVHQRVIVAAQTPQGVNTLAVLDDPADVEWALSQTQPRGFPGMMRRFDAEHDAAQSSAGDEKFAGLLGRLRAIKERGGPR